MPYRLQGIAGTWHKPGERQRRDAGIVWRGRDANGQRREIATYTTDQASARREVDRILGEVARDRVPGAGESVTLAVAARHYRASRDLSKADDARVDYIVGNDGALICAEITPATVAALVNRRRAERVTSSGRAPSADTLTRDVVAPYRAIMRFAHQQDWAPLREFPAARPLKDEIPRPPPPTARDGDVQALLDALGRAIDRVDALIPRGEKERLYIARRRHIARLRYAFVWLVHERGFRSIEWLRLDWAWLDLPKGAGRMLITKPKARWIEFELSTEAVAVLAALKPRDSGRVFPWRSRSAIYLWADRVGEPIGVKWRPHQSRRAVVSAILKATGDIKLAGAYVGHGSEKTTLRYRVVQPGEAAPAIRRSGVRRGESGGAA